MLQVLQAKIDELLALGPGVAGAIGIVVVSVFVVALLSVVIKRRGAARTAAPTWTRAQVMASRPVAPSAPLDMQERLRRLTDVGDATKGSAGYAPRMPSAPAPAVSYNTASTMPAPAVDSFDDRTQFFGADEDDSDATAFFAEPQAHGLAGADARDDMTRFFGDDSADDARVVTDATSFFSARALPRHEPPAGAHEPSAGLDDSTRFFALDDEDEEQAHQPAQPAPLPLSETQFFSPGELDQDFDGVEPAPDGHTGLLHALPPATKGAIWDNADVEGRGAAHDASGLARVRERLASVSAPAVMALSVIDSAGRVLAGETDADLTGELRSLMAESGQGNMADVEQPVRLADESTGAILLLPTGANALLGALIRDADDPQATRQSLRAAAHDIGAALQRTA